MKRRETTTKNYIGFHSSLVARANYIGFFVDWIIELIGNCVAYAMIIATASIFIGLHLYINGMMQDMRIRLTMRAIDGDSTEEPTQMWPTYVEEIQFHIEIIE